jgi:hypothetical protein
VAAKGAPQVFPQPVSVDDGLAVLGLYRVLPQEFRGIETDSPVSDALDLHQGGEVHYRAVLMPGYEVLLLGLKGHFSVRHGPVAHIAYHGATGLFDVDATPSAGPSSP